MATRSYMSIGEVLVTLKTEFPDITISKIRFLEGEGLIEPERTASGYRKFYEPDVDRLRFILREQREHFLPLRVIKDRLASGEPADADAEAPVGTDASERTPGAESGRGGEGEAASAMRTATGALFSFDELAAASGLSPVELAEVERYGLIAGRPVGVDMFYDEEALVAAKVAAAFLRYGIEPRHLRTYRNAADREAGLIEQIIMPLVKQRNPEARVRATDTIDTLCRLGADLRDAMLRHALRPYREGG